ncbi:MAG: acyltransferase [Actinomycetia bacterium]|nr:acyltransferase [Actinomycetes bacterium]
MAERTEARTPSVPRTTRPTSQPETRHFRPEVEGLRSVAILSVLAYHAAQFADPDGGGPLGAVTGALGLVTGGYLGVDVFFVISGFLITGLLVREAENTDRIHFGRFYARRARRILPAATVTLLVTLGASLLLLTVERTVEVAGDVVWAALFNADIHFATSGVDYMGEATAPSPVLHFWSLNDEEKFYLVWPVVLTLATWAAVRLRRLPLRPTLFAALLALALPSLVWSQHLVSTGAPAGYFSATSRAFELAAGGLLAIGSTWVERVPRAARVLGAIVGFGVVLVCMVTYTSLTPFPGVMALPVVLGTVLVIAGHPAGVVARALSVRPARWVGRVSYSLYLWHWPVLVLAAAHVGGQLSPKRALACVAAAFVLAWASYRFVEQPPQRARLLASTRNALLFGLAAILLTVGAAVGTGRVAEARADAQYAEVVRGITPVVKADRGLLVVGDSLTSRGQAPLEAALDAAGWDYRIDALGGRPIVSGKRATWTPLCFDTPGCGGDLALTPGEIPGTVVMALGANSQVTAKTRVAPPTATDSGLRSTRDAQGRYVITGQDTADQVRASVRTVMDKVPPDTTVYWVGLWLDDAIWGNVTWRQTNDAIRETAAQYPNARFLDWAAHVESAAVPHLPDGSHPTPEGMAMRARWLVSQLR